MPMYLDGKTNLLVMEQDQLTVVIRREIREAMGEILAQGRAQCVSTYTRDEVAKLLHCSLVTVHKLMNEGILHPIKNGHRTLFRCVEVDNFIENGGTKNEQG